MLRRYGLSAIAVVGLASLVALVWWWLVERQNERQAAYEASHKQYEYTKGDLVPGAAIDGQRSVSDPKSYREEWRSEHDLEAQREMADWAFYMLVATCGSVFVTSIGVVYVARTLKATRDAVREAENMTVVAWETLKETRISNERQLRAYVHISSATVVWRDGYVVRAEITLRNAGQTPAYGVHHETIMQVGVPDSFDISEPADIPSMADVGPGHTVTYPSDAGPFDKPTFNRIKARHLPFHVWGEIRYRDAFRPELRRTRYRLVLSKYSDDFAPVAGEGNEST